MAGEMTTVHRSSVFAGDKEAIQGAIEGEKEKGFTGLRPDQRRFFRTNLNWREDGKCSSRLTVVVVLLPAELTERNARRPYPSQPFQREIKQNEPFTSAEPNKGIRATLRSRRGQT